MPVNTNKSGAIQKCGRCLVFLPVSKFEKKRNGEYKKYCERCLTLKNQYNKKYKQDKKIKVSGIRKTPVGRSNKTPLRGVLGLSRERDNFKRIINEDNFKQVNFNLDTNEVIFNNKEPATDIYTVKKSKNPYGSYNLPVETIKTSKPIEDYNKTKKVFKEFDKIKEDCGHYCPKGLNCLKCKGLRLSKELEKYKMFVPISKRGMDKIENDEVEHASDYYDSMGLDEDGFNEDERKEQYDAAKNLFKDVIKRVENANGV